MDGIYICLFTLLSPRACVAAGVYCTVQRVPHWAATFNKEALATTSLTRVWKGELVVVNGASGGVENKGVVDMMFNTFLW